MESTIAMAAPLSRRHLPIIDAMQMTDSDFAASDSECSGDAEPKGVLAKLVASSIDLPSPIQYWVISSTPEKPATAMAARIRVKKGCSLKEDASEDDDNPNEENENGIHYR